MANKKDVLYVSDTISEDSIGSKRDLCAPFMIQVADPAVDFSNVSVGIKEKDFKAFSFIPNQLVRTQSHLIL